MYEINVSYRGHHEFATAERSITDERKLKNLLLIFMDKFPKKFGWDISVHRIEHSGYGIALEDLVPAPTLEAWEKP